MTEDLITNFIINGFYNDILKEDCYNELNENIQWSYEIQMFIITMKSLLPLTDAVGSRVEYKRFNEELKLWIYYRNGENVALLNSIDNIKSDIYWLETDNTIYSRIVPLVMVNTQWDIVLEEVIKNVLYTTGSLVSLFEAIALSKLLFLFLKFKQEPNMKNIIYDIKREIIELSQVDIISKYKENYRFDISTYPGNYTIDFEKKRIDLINLMNGISLNDKYLTIKKSIDILLDTNYENNKSKIDFFNSGLIGMMSRKSLKNVNIKDRNFIEGLGKYVYRMRKGRINPDSLKISQYILPNVFDFSEGDEFYHSLLNKCKVIKKDDEGKVIYIKTKTGIYRFQK